MSEALREAAQAVLARWDSPKWEWVKQGPTADLMAALRAALAAAQPPSDAEHRAAFAAIYTALQPASPDRSTWPAEIARLRAAAQPPAAMPVPPGMALVPVEPTPAMLDAARDWAVKKYGQGIGHDGASGCYTAMLAAAPAAQPVPATGAQPWQTMESVPKDGRTVIVARHMGDFGWIKGQARWQGGPGYVSGWISHGFDPIASNLGLAHPTHWMPLPAPPLAAAHTTTPPTTAPTGSAAAQAAPIDAAGEKP